MLILLIISGMNPFDWFQMQTPGPYNWLLNNKVYGCLFLFFVSGMVETQLISTGAFEVYLNEDQLWSKLRTGRVPEPMELFNMIDERRNTLFAGTGNLDFKKLL